MIHNVGRPISTQSQLQELEKRAKCVVWKILRERVLV